MAIDAGEWKTSVCAAQLGITASKSATNARMSASIDAGELQASQGPSSRTCKWRRLEHGDTNGVGHVMYMPSTFKGVACCYMEALKLHGQDSGHSFRPATESRSPGGEHSLRAAECQRDRTDHHPRHEARENLTKPKK